MNEFDCPERRALMQRLNDRETIEQSRMCEGQTMGPMPALVLIVFGCVLGLFIMFAAQRCTREPMPAVTKITGDINCQYCHGVRLNNAKRYAKYWKARRAFEHTKLVQALDEEAENARMVQLITGGKP